jgi:hypothetical protein
MKLSIHIEVVSRMMTGVINQCKLAQEEQHNRNLDNIGRASLESKATRLCGQIESFCHVMGIRPIWAGLYPTFEVAGFQTHSIRDAIAMTFGQPSFACLLEREKEGFSYTKLPVVGEAV